MSSPVRETDIGRVAKSWLESRDLEVFQEVCVGGHRIDLVGRAHGVIVAVECKVSFGLPVIAQARRWTGDDHSPEATESWVVVGVASRGYNSDERRLALHVCGLLGIGVIYADPARRFYDTLWKLKRPALIRAPKDLAGWDAHLHPEQKHAAEAGTNGGGYSTQFKRTMAELTAYVRQHPGVTTGEAEKAIKHEYSRAFITQALPRMLASVGRRRGPALAGLRVEGNGVRATLWPQAEGDF